MSAFSALSGSSAVAAALLLSCSGAAAGVLDRNIYAPAFNRNIYAPYLFQPPPDHPASPLDDQKARTYRNALQDRIWEEERRSAVKGAGGEAERARRLYRDRGELQRIDRYLQQPPAPTPPVRTGREAMALGPTPSVPPSIETPDIGTPRPILRGGGHPQPRPADIERLEAARGKRVVQPVPSPPAYDFFGHRMD
jgi:hypothetical protein